MVKINKLISYINKLITWKNNKHMQATPHWTIYYINAIGHDPNQVVIYVKNVFF